MARRHIAKNAHQCILDSLLDVTSFLLKPIAADSCTLATTFTQGPTFDTNVQVYCSLTMLQWLYYIFALEILKTHIFFNSNLISKDPNKCFTLGSLTNEIHLNKNDSKTVAIQTELV